MPPPPINTTSTAITVRGLTASHKYRVSVTASTSVGRSIPATRDVDTSLYGRVLSQGSS